MAKKILIIDDDPNMVALLSHFIKSSGFDVVTATDGMEGLQKARNQQPDLIILDVMLPKLDGFKVSRFLKFDENHRNIPIIMLTAKTDSKDEEVGKRTGADVYLTKPVKKQDLLASINEYLK